MLNSNEKVIIKTLTDSKYLQYLSVNIRDIKRIINVALREIKELENICKMAYENGEKFYSLCNKLGGHNEIFDNKYPEYNYFDLNYKSLLITVQEILDQNNNSKQFKLQKLDVYIYPDICKKTIDEIFVLDMNKKVNFNKIIKELKKENIYVY